MTTITIDLKWITQQEADDCCAFIQKMVKHTAPTCSQQPVVETVKPLPVTEKVPEPAPMQAEPEPVAAKLEYEKDVYPLVAELIKKNRAAMVQILADFGVKAGRKLPESAFPEAIAKIKEALAS